MDKAVLEQRCPRRPTRALCVISPVAENLLFCDKDLIGSATTLILPAQQLRQPRHVGRNPPRLIFVEHLVAQDRRSTVCENGQASSGRWMSLKLGALVVSTPSMTFRQTTHFAVSPSILGTSEGVAE